MDAEHRAVAMRLRRLPLDGGSHENLSQIARAVYHADFGWTQGACAALRDKLIDLMGGVSDEIYKNGDSLKSGDGDDTCACAGGGACDADCGRDSGESKEVEDGGTADDSDGDTGGSYRGVSVHLDGLTGYDVLGNERHKAVAKLKEVSNGYFYTSKMQKGEKTYFGPEIFREHLVSAIDVSREGVKNDDMLHQRIADRLIHLLGGDQPSGIDVLREMDERETEGRITDELRGYVQDNECEHRVLLSMPPQDEYHLTKNGTRLLAIADRIDVQFNWTMLSRSSELGCCKLRINELESERDEARAKLDEYGKTHVELPRDKGGRVFVIDGGARVDDLVLTVRQMTLTKDGWKIRAYDEGYEVERESSFFEVCDKKPDPVEEIVEKLTLGEITQSEAIERIKSLGQE